MAAAIHIPIDTLSPDVKTLLSQARADTEVVIDGKGGAFRISWLSEPASPADHSRLLSAIEDLDEDWSRDLEEIIASRKIDTARDLWE